MPSFLQQVRITDFGSLVWFDYYWVCLFAFCIGFSTTVAEPALIAVAMKANQVSGGSIKVNGLRFAVALGVAFGITLGCYRIVEGLPEVVLVLEHLGHLEGDLAVVGLGLGLRGERESRDEGQAEALGGVFQARSGSKAGGESHRDGGRDRVRFRIQGATNRT